LELRCCPRTAEAGLGKEVGSIAGKPGSEERDGNRSPANNQGVPALTSAPRPVPIDAIEGDAESDRRRAEPLDAAEGEARQVLDEARRQAAQRIAEAEVRAEKILEEAHDEATELTNAARGEVEQRLEWARAQASAIINRAQESAEELLSAAKSVSSREPSDPEDRGPGGKGDKPTR